LAWHSDDSSGDRQVANRQPTETPRPRTQGRTGWLGLGWLALKLGPKLWKVALAGASVAAYSVLFTWQFAILLVLAILIHEWGHVFAMRRCGMPVKGVYLIPFVGGVAVGQAYMDNRLTEAQNYEIAMMGPVFGLGSCLALLVPFWLTGSEFWGASAAAVALVNLFNLLPIFPLDGGRVLRALFASAGQRAVLIGMGGSLLLTALGLFALGAPMLAVLLGIGVMEFWAEFRRGSPGTPMSAVTIAAAVAGYLGLAALLGGVILAAAETSGGALALEILRG
jgi:Zn-dependent protease